MRNPRSFVVAVANPKGGVAKTTSVVSLAGALVRKDKEVLAVDLDAQANLTLALGKDPLKIRRTITDVLFDSATLGSVSLESSVPGLDFVPSNSSMFQAERFLPVRKNFETILRRAIGSHSQFAPVLTTEPIYKVSIDKNTSGHSHDHFYDFLLLDCPPSSGTITLIALIAADLLIIPTQPEYFSAWTLRSMMKMIHEVRQQHNPRLAYRILITMFDRRNRVHNSVLEQIQASFGDCLFETVINMDTKLRECERHGLPITHYDGRSRSALQYETVAQELIDYVQTK